MDYRKNYKAENAPRIGVVANAIGVYSVGGKEEAEEQLRRLFDEFKEEGVISRDSIYYKKRIFGPLEAQEAAHLFGRARVDVVIVLNSAFTNGNTFLTLANDPYLFKIPMIVTAPEESELEKPEWTTNAWCSAIMNNYVARKIGRKVFTLAGWPGDASYKNELASLLNVSHAVKELRSDFLGRFGDAPGGFHSASGNQLDYARMFGTRIETVDWTEVMNTYRTGEYEGYNGGFSFTEDEVTATAEEMKEGRPVLISEEYVRNAARLYQAFRVMIRANGFTSSAFRCWPEMGKSFIGVSPCLSMGWLLSKGDVYSAACEGDWPTAVAQTICTLLTGKPGICLDFVNVIGKSPVVQLGHCGVGIGGYMAPNDPALKNMPNDELKRKVMSGEIGLNDGIVEKSPERLGGGLCGPAHIGQYAYGVKTAVNLIQDANGIFKMLVFSGENGPETARGILYSGCDIAVNDHVKLHETVMDHGFNHHLAVGFGDIRKELETLCKYYGIEYFQID